MLLESPCRDTGGNRNNGHQHSDDYDNGAIAAFPASAATQRSSWASEVDSAPGPADLAGDHQRRAHQIPADHASPLEIGNSAGGYCPGGLGSGMLQLRQPD